MLCLYARPSTEVFENFLYRDDAGVARQVSEKELVSAMSEPHLPTADQIDTFLAAHAGAVQKTLQALKGWDVLG